MNINFTGNIKILINEDNLIKWELIKDKIYRITIKEEISITNYLIDLNNKSIKIED
nr:unnamed protein product [uncultured bacterium]